MGVDHQAGVQKAGKHNAVFFHAADGGQNHLAHGAGVHVGRDHRRGRIGAHAAGVGPGVAVLQALVVLAGGQRQHVFAVAHHDKAGFFALQKLFNHHARLAAGGRIAKSAVGQHEVHRRMRLGQRHGHDHALACGQTIGLDHDGRAHFVQVGVGGGGVRKHLKVRRRNAVALHERFGKSLGALELRCCLRRPKDAQAVGPKVVHHATGQRAFGANHGERNLVFNRPVAQGGYVGNGQVFQAGVERGAAVARRHINHLHFGGLGEFPGQRVFAATAANDQNIHSAAL